MTNFYSLSLSLSLSICSYITYISKLLLLLNSPRGEVALHGDPVAVRGAVARLEHREGFVRAAALRSLSFLARLGDEEVMAKASGG